MKKTIEVEYVGIEDIQEIMDDAFALMKLGHYVSAEFDSLFGKPVVRVRIMLGGWDKDKEYDYEYKFDVDDDEESVLMMNSCKNTIKNLLAEGDM